MARNTERLNPKSKSFPRGEDLLHDPVLNKGTAFTEAERDAFGLRGLLPPHVTTMHEQVLRVMDNYGRIDDDLQKFIFMTALHSRNETLFYRVVVDNMEELMPIIYTPTVGRACQEFGHIFRRAGGIYLSLNDRGRMKQVLKNWSESDVRAVVVTDGERILGLGDLGAAGMGIPIGKLHLYTACAGVQPSYCLPVTLDVGTNNEEFLTDPLYLGLSKRRIRGEAYDEFVQEFIEAVTDLFPKALIQFEDFGNTNAFRLLHRYRDKVCTFNDDIQGTAAVTLAGLMSALRITGRALADQKIVFLGAGEAGIGIADLVASAIANKGVDEAEAKRRCWFVDSKGLVVKSRGDLQEHKLGYAHDHEPIGDLLGAVEKLEPTALIGVSGQPSTFTQPVVEAMSRINERPIIFALSNPTSKAECTAEQAYRWSGGRAVFASGSPFDPVELGGRRHVPGQGNNAYIFPGVALGVILSGSRLVTDEMFLTAANALAREVSEHDLAEGRVYPPLPEVRDVSAIIATAVVRIAHERGLAREPSPDDIVAHVRKEMFDPTYRNYVE
jgi:malate dehydrogenase (oxaloacetate-decarboxylating)(NADP+)